MRPSYLRSFLACAACFILEGPIFGSSTPSTPNNPQTSGGSRASDLMGQSLPVLELKGENGGTLANQPWSSSSLPGQVSLVFYVDPDERGLNEAFESALKKADYDHTKVRSYAIINFAATWLPDSLLAGLLKDKQKEYKETVYIKDLSKVLVQKWNLKDDSYNTLILDKKGIVRYQSSGAINPKETEKVVQLIKGLLSET